MFSVSFDSHCDQNDGTTLKSTAVTMDNHFTVQYNIAMVTYLFRLWCIIPISKIEPIRMPSTSPIVTAITIPVKDKTAIGKLVIVHRGV